MDELATWLGHERTLLELLVFKLVESRHLLAAGETRFLALAAAELERALRRVQEAELARSLMVSRLARELGRREPDLTLPSLSRDSVEPYRTLFDDHRRAFTALVAEIEEETLQTRRLATQGTRDRLLGLVGEPARTVDAGAAADHLTDTLMELQVADAGCQALLGATAHPSLPTLAGFLS